EIERLDVLAGRHRGSSAPAHSDEETGAAHVDEERALAQRFLVRVLRRDVAVAAREHDGLVVAAHFAAARELEASEVAREVGPAELVVVRGAADGPVDHDLQRRGDARGLAVVAFPRAARIRQLQAGNGKPRKPRLGLAAGAGGALVADLSARARARARMRRESG